MPIKIGGIDVTDALVNTEMRVGVLEKIVEHLLARATPGSITSEDIDRFRKAVVEQMQRKYPEAGIEWKPKQNTIEK